MKKKIMTVFTIIIFILIAITCCIMGHVTVKKYFYKNYINKKINKELAFYDNLNLSTNPNIIEVVETTSTTTTTRITTTVRTTSKTTTTSTTSINLTTTSNISTTEKILEELEDVIVNKENINIVDDNEKVLDDMTLKELTDKLNKSLNSTLSNTGHYFANYYVKTGLDPYLAVAIVLHETGCKWTCSKLVRECNNIGGIKGKNSCNGGSYKKFDTLEEGIYGYLDMLYNNYYSKGLNTPELINPKYAASTTWSEKINNYILEIKEK